jgi:hypothetical protein
MHYPLEDVSTFEDFYVAIRSVSKSDLSLYKKATQIISCTNPFTGVDHSIKLCTYYASETYYWVVNGDVEAGSGEKFYARWMKLCLTP